MEGWDIFGFTYSDRHSISLDTSVRAWPLFVENEEFVKRKKCLKLFLDGLKDKIILEQEKMFFMALLWTQDEEELYLWSENRA